VNLILEGSAFVDFHTDMRSIFLAVPSLENYWYLITDIELNFNCDSRLTSGTAVLSGTELKEICSAHTVQFIWAVFSAFDTRPAALPEALPFADGNTDFWRGSPKQQATGACFEIACWDSGATLFIGISQAFSEQLRARFPDIQDLDAVNHR
jgi:hypothetical protein